MPLGRGVRVTALDVKTVLDAFAYKLPKMNSIGAHLFRQGRALGENETEKETGDGGGGGGEQEKQKQKQAALGASSVCADDSFNGALTLGVHALEALGDQPFSSFTGFYVCLEVDSFGQFFLQAKTQTAPKSDAPQWNEVCCVTVL